MQVHQPEVDPFLNGLMIRIAFAILLIFLLTIANGIFRFEVVDMDGTRVDKIPVTPLAPEQSPFPRSSQP